jgi:hypothetical protein
MNNRRTIFIALTLLAATAACVVPGLQTVSAPAPTVDTAGVLSTMVAETVSAAITLTEQAVPTPTLVPTSTPAPTLTPTPEIVPPENTLTIQKDGSTLFVDARAGYEVTLPKGWLVAGVNKKEFLDAFTLAPEVQKFLLTIQNKDPNLFHLFAVDMQDGHFQNGFFTNMNFIWDEQNTGLLKNDDGLKAGVAQLADAAPEPEILSTTLSTTLSGISMVVIESKYTVKNSSNKDIVILQKQDVLNAKTGTVTVTVSTVEGLKDAVYSAFDAMLETIKIAVE